MEPLVTVNSTELARFKVIADAFDKSITRGIRKSIRNMGAGAVAEVKKSLRLPPPDDKPGTAGSRDALAEGTRVTVSFSKKSAGAKIVTSGSRLGEHAGFTGAYNKASFRHPVYGRPWADAVTQEGRPYFGAVIVPYLDGPEAKKELEAVLDQAVLAIGGRN